MSNDLEVSDLVPFFKAAKHQIIFEFFYLLISLFICLGFIFTLLTTEWTIFTLFDEGKKTLMLSFLAGYLGGWAFVAKWFYRVTARGRNDQYECIWQSNKFYWRIFSPLISALIAFTTYLLVISDFFPLELKNGLNNKTAFAFSFLLGYFSDIILTKLSKWIENVVPDRESNG